MYGMGTDSSSRLDRNPKHIKRGKKRVGEQIKAHRQFLHEHTRYSSLCFQAMKPMTEAVPRFKKKR